MTKSTDKSLIEDTEISPEDLAEDLVECLLFFVGVLGLKLLQTKNITFSGFTEPKVKISVFWFRKWSKL